MNLETLRQTITERPALDFGSIFSASLDLFKKVWMQGFIVLLLTMVAILPYLYYDLHSNDRGGCYRPRTIEDR